MSLTWITPFAAVLLAVPVAFDREAAPTPCAFASRGGGAFVRFDLPEKEPGNESRCRITAFKLGLDGKDQELWKTEGWYARQCWLSADGRYLVRLGPWARGSGPEDDDLAVAFYADGKLLRSWSTRDLVQDDSQVDRSASHYEWQRSVDYQHAFEAERFVIETLDDLRWTFEVRTGEVLLREHATVEPQAEERRSLEVDGDPKAVEAIRAYYASLSARDWTAFATHFQSGAVLSTRWTPPGADAPTVMMSSVADFVARAPEGPGSQPIFEEWPTGIDVYRSGDMAMAWMNYGVRFGTHEALKEWTGTDAITLIRHEDRWRITSIAWSGD